MTTTEPTTTDLINSLQQARNDLSACSRYTSFSGWYKGDHARCRAAVTRALVRLASALRQGKGAGDAALLAEVQSFLLAHRAHRAEGWALTDAIAAWGKVRP